MHRNSISGGPLPSTPLGELTAFLRRLTGFNSLTPTVAIWVSCARPPWAWASDCPGCQNYKWRLNPVWHKILLYSCSHKATVGVKGLRGLLLRVGRGRKGKGRGCVQVVRGIEGPEHCLVFLLDASLCCSFCRLVRLLCGRFMLTAVGCADPRDDQLPVATRFDRDQQDKHLALIRCLSSQQSWQVTCQHGVWKMDDVGNCTATRPHVEGQPALPHPKCPSVRLSVCHRIIMATFIGVDERVYHWNVKVVVYRFLACFVAHLDVCDKMQCD